MINKLIDINEEIDNELAQHMLGFVTFGFY